MAQITAVGWLVEFIQDHCIRIDEKIIEKAKAMEKEQIIDAFNDGDFMSCGSEKDAINYYNYLYNK